LLEELASVLAPMPAAPVSDLPVLMPYLHRKITVSACNSELLEHIDRSPIAMKQVTFSNAYHFQFSNNLFGCLIEDTRLPNVFE
jgi:hypothetical protein